MSLISAGTATINIESGEQYSTKIDYRAGVADAFADTASEALKTNSNIAPTIIVRRGDPVNVFVAQDLDFSSVFQGEE